MLNRGCIFSCGLFNESCVKIITQATVVKSTYSLAVFLNKFLTHFINHVVAFIYTPTTPDISGLYTLTTPITITTTI